MLGLNTKALLSRTKRARKNLALKLVLESRFIPELRAYFNNIANEFKLFYSATGQVITQSSYSDETKSVLRKQYMRTSNAFSSEMREELIEDELSKSKYLLDLIIKQKTEEEISATIDAALLLYIKNVTPNRAFNLDTTTSNDINRSLEMARNELVQEGIPLSNIAIATVATRILKRKFKGRINTISMSETQFMAESTKQIESTIILNRGEGSIGDLISPISDIDTRGKKQWASVLDANTRQSHANADGQVKLQNEPFVVGGELLPYPGSSALGASIGTTINCRCSSLHVIS